MARKFNKDGMIYRNRFTLASLIVALGMYGIAQFAFEINAQMAGVHQQSEVPIGGAFTMIDQHGNTFTEQNLRGKTSLIFFGFTHCPDICPTSLITLSEVYEQLPKRKQRNTQIIFVTVDPARDTQEVMAHYISAFHPSVIGLRGTTAQTKAIEQAYLVYSVFDAPDETGFYNVNHSGYIYLMDKDGKYVQHFTHKNTAAEILAAL